MRFGKKYGWRIIGIACICVPIIVFFSMPLFPRYDLTRPFYAFLGKKSIESVVWSYDEEYLAIKLKNSGLKNKPNLFCEIWLASRDFSKKRKVLCSFDTYPELVSMCFSRDSKHLYYTSPLYSLDTTGNIIKTSCVYSDAEKQALLKPSEDMPSWTRYMVEIDPDQIIFIPYFNVGSFRNDSLYLLREGQISELWNANTNKPLLPYIVQTSTQGILSSSFLNLKATSNNPPEEYHFKIPLRSVLSKRKGGTLDSDDSLTSAITSERMHADTDVFTQYDSENANPRYGLSLPSGKRIGPFTPNRKHIIIEQKEAVWIDWDDKKLKYLNAEEEISIILKKLPEKNLYIAGWNSKLGEIILSGESTIYLIKIKNPDSYRAISVSGFFE